MGRCPFFVPKIVKWPERQRAEDLSREGAGGMWFAEKGSGLTSQENTQFLPGAPGPDPELHGEK